jgi:hypothetical protein
LLFYKKQGLEESEFVIAPDLEEKVNKINVHDWKSVVFCSGRFVNYVKELTLLNPADEDGIELALTVLFRIVTISDSMLVDWVAMMIDRVFLDERRCDVFLRFLNGEYGGNLGVYVGLSDIAAVEVGKLIQHVCAGSSDLGGALLLVLKGFHGSSSKRIFSIVILLTYTALKIAKIDWSNQSKLLILLAHWMTIEPPKDMARPLLKQYYYVFDTLMDLILENCVEGSYVLFDVHVLNRIATTVKRSESFHRLVQRVSCIRPDLFMDLADANATIRTLMNSVSMAPSMDYLDGVELDLRPLWSNMQKFLFHGDKAIRKKAKGIGRKILGKTDPFIRRLMAKQSMTCSEGNGITFYFAGLIPEMCRRLSRDSEEHVCDEFMDLLPDLCYQAPRTMGLYFDMIFESFFSCKDPKLLKVLQHMTSLDSKYVAAFSEEHIHIVMELRWASSEAVSLLRTFREYANGSQLSAACLEWCFLEDDDESSEAFLELLNEGLVPGEIEIPENVRNVMKLRFANVLWDLWPDKRDALLKFMLNALKIATPFSLFGKSKTVAKALNILKEYWCESFV